MNKITSILQYSRHLKCRKFGYHVHSKMTMSSSSNREKMYFDVLTIGAGPAGLATAIRLKQLSIESGIDLSVCVIEKASEIGGHILSGNVFETHALEELFPNWRDMNCPINSMAEKDEFLVLTETSSFVIPHFLMPPQLNNHGNYIISLSQLVRWLAEKAEELGVEIYPGFAGSEVLYSEDGTEVIGVTTKESGIGKDGLKKDTFTEGIDLIARQTIFAEGCRGSCTEDVIAKFNLRNGKDIQTYGLGLKEVWEIPEEQFKKGFVQHTVGYPLQDSLNSQVFGGTFLYHCEPNLVYLGLVIGLDYENPYINPYNEFQRWKHHPAISSQLKNGRCISYGARVLNEGGFHAIPKLTFPGGVLVGCSAGFLNSVKIKGTHTAMKSGMLAAESIFPHITRNLDKDHLKLDADISSNKMHKVHGLEVKQYEDKVYSSWIVEELKQNRNSHAAFHYGFAYGMIYTAFSSFISKGREPWTLNNKISDSKKTKPAKEFKPIKYIKPDGELSFDLLTNLQRSGTSHEHDQPAHLKIKPNMPLDISIKEYDGPEQRFCPAGVYEYSEPDANNDRHLIINAQNCLHCKCCSIKTPTEYIKWTVPEGGGGPNYTVM